MGNIWRRLPYGRVRAIRWAPRMTEPGTNFGLFSEVADRVELCLFGDDGTENADRSARGGRVRLAWVPARHQPGSAVRVPGPTARTTRPRGSAATRTSC